MPQFGVEMPQGDGGMPQFGVGMPQGDGGMPQNGVGMRQEDGGMPQKDVPGNCLTAALEPQGRARPPNAPGA